MHDVSIKLLAVVEGPRELEDDDDSHCCRAIHRKRCMTEQTVGGDKYAKKIPRKEKKTNKGD